MDFQCNAMQWSRNILVGCQMEREREKDNRKSNTFELYPDLLSRTFIVILTSKFMFEHNSLSYYNLRFYGNRKQIICKINEQAYRAFHMIHIQSFNHMCGLNIATGETSPVITPIHFYGYSNFSTFYQYITFIS